MLVHVVVGKSFIAGRYVRVLIDCLLLRAFLLGSCRGNDDQRYGWVEGYMGERYRCQ